MLTSYRAAWVPDDDVQRDWNDAACLAIDWIEAEAVKQGTHAVLVTSTFGGPILTYAFSGRILNSPLSRYVRGRTHFTPRSGRHVPRGVAVLSFVPTRRALDFAIELAQGSSLCVVESATEPVAGWAADVGAINLLAGFATAQHPPTFLEHLDRLASNGDNFGDTFGRRTAQQILDDLQHNGLLQRNNVVRALAARNISPRGQRQIEKMIDRMIDNGPRSPRDTSASP